VTKRETKAFRPSEITTILKAALAIADTKRPSNAAKRWVPWILAYTGARAGEITQLRGTDVVEEDGVAAIRITPEAGAVKMGRPRIVPVHEHLVEQGFVRFVRANGKGPLFYNEPRQAAGAADATNPRKPRYVKAREHLATWVRELGVSDPELQPNHAWRHTFKQIADRHDISERISDWITGHSPASVGRGYGAPTLEDMAAALKKFPRYMV
jgi:integrase